MDNDRKREIECKIYSLENEVKDLKSELNSILKEEKDLISKEFAGKCYKINKNTFFKVKEVPNTEYSIGIVIVYNPESFYVCIENNHREELCALRNEISEEEFLKIMNDAISFLG